MIHQLHLLQRLKQQPRLSGTYVKSSTATIKNLQQDINTLQNSFSEFSDISDKIVDIYKAFGDATLSLGLGINKLAGFQDSFNKTIVQGVKDSTFLEQRNASLAKTLGIHGRKAFELGQKYDELSGHLKIGGEAIRVFGINLNKIAPGYAKAIAAGNDFGKNMLMTQRILTKNIGLSEDAANNYELYAAGVGVASTNMIDYQRQLANDVETATKLTNQFADIVTDIAGLGADIQMQFGKMPGSLELAVLKARQLGMTFDKIDAAATNALNIETSIGQEIEYQLLSGKRLVDQSGQSLTNKLREAKVMGNANKMAEATAEIFEGQKETLEGSNFYAQEQLAALMGMSRAEMMRAYQQQKMQKQLQAANSDLKIDALMKMDTTGIKNALKTTTLTAVQQEQLLKEIQENTAPQTTDEMLAELLDMARTKGIKTQSAGVGFDAMRDAGLALKDATLGMTEFARSTAMAGIYGQLQSIKQVPVDELKTFAETMPGASAAVTAFTNAITNAISFVSYKEAGSGRTGVDIDAPAAKDAIIMNDGIVRFHPSDKFMQVNDSTMIAGTNVDGNRKLAQAISGGGDSNKMISAIRSALQGMSIHVHVDPMKIRDEIKFNDRGIN
jgi:hypothetical protein